MLHLPSYRKCTSDNARKKVPGSCYIEKIANFQKIHCKRGELFTEYIRERCREHLDSTHCDYCSSHHWIGPELSRVLGQFRTRPTHHTSFLFGEHLPTMIKANQDLLITTSLRFRFAGFLSWVLQVSRTMILLGTSQCNMGRIAIE